MYHRKFSFFTGCGSPLGSFGSSGCSISSAILLSFPGLRLLLQSTQLHKQLVDADVEDPVHHKKENAKDEHRHNHYGRRHLHFLLRGNNHLAHLCADIGKKLGKVRPRTHRVAGKFLQRAWLLPFARTIVRVCYCCLRCHTSIPSRPAFSPGAYQLNLAGAEGFEPPSSVLETDSLTVELTPLKAGFSDQVSGVSSLRFDLHALY